MPTGDRDRTVADAAATGDRYETLVALRDRIARRIDRGGCPDCGRAIADKDLAALSRRLEVIVADLAGMGAAADTGVADALAERRAARQAAEG